MYQNTRQKKSAKTRSNADRTRIAALLLGDGGIGKTYLNLKLAKNPKPYAWELDHWGFWQFHTRELDISKVPSMSDLKLLCESKFSSSSPAQDRKEHQIRPSDSTGRQSPRGEEEESEIKSNNVEELSQKENKVEDEHDDIGKSTRLGPKKEQVGLDKVEVANESNASNKIWLETYCIRSKLSENIEHTLKDVFSEMSVVALCYQVSDAETLENAVHRVSFTFYSSLNRSPYTFSTSYDPLLHYHCPSFHYTIYRTRKCWP